MTEISHVLAAYEHFRLPSWTALTYSSYTQLPHISVLRVLIAIFGLLPLDKLRTGSQHGVLNTL